MQRSVARSRRNVTPSRSPLRTMPDFDEAVNNNTASVQVCSVAPCNQQNSAGQQ